MAATNVFIVMEEINDKLKILNYESRFCAKKVFTSSTVMERLGSFGS